MSAADCVARCENCSSFERQQAPSRVAERSLAFLRLYFFGVLVPFLPVYGLTLPLVEKLSFWVPFGALRM